MICGSGEESEIDLWGRIRPPLIYNSSLTITSSPSTDTPSIRTYNKTYEGIITCKPWVGKKKTGNITWIILSFLESAFCRVA